MTVTDGVRSTQARLAQQMAQCEDVQTVINIAVTAEALAVTLLGAAVEAAQQGALALTDEQLESVQASRIAEKAHYDYLIAAGAQPLTMTFNIPNPAIATDVPTFLTTVIALEEAFIAAYMAAAQVFSLQGQPDLVLVAHRAAAVEGDHRAQARQFAIEAGLIDGVPNNLAFEQALFASVGEAAATLQALGFIGGTGPEITFPGPTPIVNPGVTNLEL
jgi:hypothetical protein